MGKSCILTSRDCEVLAMGIRHRLTDSERDDLTKDDVRHMLKRGAK